MAKYRRRHDSNVWHRCLNCSNWPTYNYIESESKPLSGEQCNECQAKQTVGTCQD